MVEELCSYSPQDLADLDALMHELSATSFCNEELLNNALNDANVHVYVIRDEGHIVATGTLCIKHRVTVGQVPRHGGTSTLNTLNQTAA